MFFLPLSLPQKEIPRLAVSFPGESGVAGEISENHSDLGRNPFVYLVSLHGANQMLSDFPN